MAEAADDVPRRRRVAIATSSWGAHGGERAAVVRLVAGALALDCEVVIVSLDDRGDPGAAPPRLAYDGIFAVHSVMAPPARPRLGHVLDTALASGAIAGSRAAGRQPEIASRRLLAIDHRPSTEAVTVIGELAPDVVIVAGIETMWLPEALPVGPDRPRVVVLPLLGDDERLGSAAVTPLAEISDAVVALSDGEERRLLDSVGAREAAKVRRLRPSWLVNRGAAASGLAGLASFGRYVLVISGWPDDDPESAADAPAHDYLRAVAGDVSVAEVRHGQWLVSEMGRYFEVPWSASRMNLWRLMARAIATVDVRRQGPVGREAVESMMFGTPVIVPAGSVAAEHAARSNGGLWYSAPGEMLDQVRYFVENEGRRNEFGAAGLEWAEREHGNTETLVSDVQRLVAR